MTQKRIFSGMQPTNRLQLGNYLGALKNWVKLQDEGAQCLYCVVDLHAITMPQDPELLKKSTRETAAAYMAAGVDANKSILFAQSSVPAHAELNWLLACQTPIGWLNRMTQFKDKAGKDKEKAGLGLYAYPVLMAADILLYHTTHVPVGEDQKQHLELTRDLAIRFNQHYAKRDFFTVPEPYIMGEATRVMSLQDGTKKMSKSDPSDKSRINLTDTADVIAQKIKKATSDAGMVPGNAAEAEGRAEAINLISIYAALADTDSKSVMAQFGGQQFSAFKGALTELAVAKLSPVTDAMNRYMADVGEIDRILKSGGEKANEIAQKTLQGTMDILGFWRG